MKSSLDLEHDELRRLMDAFRPVMPGGPEADSTRMAQLRIRFSDLFRKHMSHEHEVFRALRTDQPGCPVDAAVREHADRTRELFLGYSAHVNRWSLRQIEEDQEGYRESVLALQRACRALMAWEERKLHPLVAKN